MLENCATDAAEAALGRRVVATGLGPGVGQPLHWPRLDRQEFWRLRAGGGRRGAHSSRGSEPPSRGRRRRIPLPCRRGPGFPSRWCWASPPAPRPSGRGHLLGRGYGESSSTGAAHAEPVPGRHGRLPQFRVENHLIPSSWLAFERRIRLEGDAYFEVNPQSPAAVCRSSRAERYRCSARRSTSRLTAATTTSSP